MDLSIREQSPRRSTVRVALTPEQASALERRAKRNDRFPWLEASRILRETLERDGDLTPEPKP
jgi:hypothetical protein